MTQSDWIAKVIRDAPKLRSLIEDYHPAVRRSQEPLPVGPITAAGAEAACTVVRAQIAKDQKHTDSLTRFDEAVAHAKKSEFLGECVATINSILNDTWFGVPETTACWSIEGFTEAVDLMDDPPDEVFDAEVKQHD